MTPETGMGIDDAAPVSASGPLKLSLEPLGDPAALEPLWIDLERRADPAFFLSWQWIGCWLRSLPPGTRPWLLSLRDGPAIVGLALFTPRCVRRLAVLRTGQWWLHETGDPRLDAATIEDNGLLLARGHTAAGDLATRSLRWFLANAPDCDELVLGGIGPALKAEAQRAAAGTGFAPRLLHETVRPYADLEAARARGGDYLLLLSRNTRQAVRRALRLYEETGRLRLRIAEDLDEALGYFARLKLLHQAYWTGRGKPGAFASPFFERFHRALIRDGFATGAVQLCRISAGDREIGYLYNFAWRGWVHAYQSGFAYADDNRLKPGLVSHYLAILEAIGGGYRVYDFMAGDGQHKRSLSTHAPPMTWLALTTARLPWRIEDALRRLKRRLLDKSVALNGANREPAAMLDGIHN